MSLPVIRGTSAALYPFTLTLSFLTGVGDWQNGTQQRWIRQPGARVKLALPYSQLTQAQKDTLKGAITSAKGRFDNTLSITIGATTYTNLGLDADEWAATESRPTQYAGPVKLTQAIAQNLSPGTAGTAFPILANGAMAMVPFTQKKRFQTAAQRVEAGPNYTFAEFAGGLANYPTDGLMAWGLHYDRLRDTDTAALVAHFIANWGRAFSFSFTDEDSVVYANTHYAADDLVITYRGVDDSSLELALESTTLPVLANIVTTAGVGKSFYIAAGGSPPSGWETTGFSDSSWSAPVLVTFTVGAAPAGSQWVSDSNSFRAPNDMTLLRQPFSLARAISSATITIAADNWLDAMYVNGTLVYSPGTGGGVGPFLYPPVSVSIPFGLFIVGSNLIATQVQNGPGGPQSVAWSLTLS